MGRERRFWIPSPIKKHQTVPKPPLRINHLGGFRFDDTIIVGDTPEVTNHVPKDIKSQTVA